MGRLTAKKSVNADCLVRRFSLVSNRPDRKRINLTYGPLMPFVAARLPDLD